MRELKLEDFAGRVGTVYDVPAGDSSVPMTLAEAQALPGGQRESAFRLLFKGPVHPLLPQAIYPFRHGEEVDEIFIVPVAQDANGTQYEAIFF